VNSARGAFLGADIAGGSTLALATLSVVLDVTRGAVAAAPGEALAIVPTLRGVSAVLSRDF
jgi:hypothetical protein